MPKQTPGNLLT